jgi:DNA-binding transcriptional MerR regulator
MYKTDQIKISVFANMLGITVHTLQRLDKDGIVPAFRTDTGRRYYTIHQYSQYIGIVQDRKKKSHK